MRDRADLYADLFGDPSVDDQLSPVASLQAMLDVEAALAAVQEELGVIPASACETIAAAARADRYDRAALAAAAADDGNLVIPLVRELTRQVGAIDARAARYVHWGATSQDIQDTGLVLQMQAAAPHILSSLDRAASAAAGHARRHNDTVMPGRTWLQQATPITFGLKAAGWCAALDRQRAALAEALEDARVLQFGGASGTLAALGDRGLEVADRLGARLALKVPDLSWHTHRDRLARVACALGIVCGTCGKIARDLSLLAQTEVAEASEPGRGGSSTMPHKRNPVRASAILAAATRAPGLVATMLAAMPQEHERGLGGWQAEWVAVPELLRLTGGSARATAEALEGLTVDTNRMRANAALTEGATQTEAVAMALAAHLGRTEAHHVVEDAVHMAGATGKALADVLAGDPRVAGHLPQQEIRDRLTPENYLGIARLLVTRVLDRRTVGA
jgi:3-carboxy-cis,cis-muconate cycloisomerase